VEELFNLYGTYLWAGLAGAGLLLLIWLIVLTVQVQQSRRHYQRLIRGAKGETLEAALNQQFDRLDEHSRRLNDLTALTEQINATLQQAIQKVGLVRYNPFTDTGGDQSFVVALLDAGDNGVVINGLYSRSDVRVYAKPIKAGKSSYPLSSEEEQAIRQAR